MKPGYTVRDADTSNNPIIIECCNYHIKNLVAFYGFCLKRSFTESANTVAIFKIKPKSK